MEQSNISPKERKQCEKFLEKTIYLLLARPSYKVIVYNTGSPQKYKDIEQSYSKILSKIFKREIIFKVRKKKHFWNLSTLEIVEDLETYENKNRVRK